MLHRLFPPPEALMAQNLIIIPLLALIYKLKTKAQSESIITTNDIRKVKYNKCRPLSDHEWAMFRYHYVFCQHFGLLSYNAV
jgi:hypothetical protein